MATFTDITTGLQTISAPGAIPGTFDSSTLTTPFEVKVQVASFTGAAPATLVIESSANGIFSDAVQNIETLLPPNVSAASDVWLSFPWYTLVGAAFGSANNKFRARLASIAGGVLKVRAMVVQ